MTLQEMEEMMDSCVRCSKCKFIPQIAIRSKRFSHICPSIEFFNFHAYSGGGRMILANAYLKGRIELGPDALHVLYACTNCGGCEVSCKWVYDLEPNEVIHEFRVKAVECGLGPLPKHQKYIELVSRVGNPYGEATDNRSIWSNGLELNTSPDSNTVYFVGCTTAYRRPEIARATALVLSAAGVNFRVLGTDETCCGSPVYRVGDLDRAVEIMKKNITDFKKKGIKRIITSCAGCYNMFKTEYPRYVEHDLEVFHISQVLDELIDDGKLKFNKDFHVSVTYHDPCHLGRMSEPHKPYDGEKIEVISQVFIWDPPKPVRQGADGEYDASRNILQKIPGVKLVEMERIREYAYCCGAGGGVKSAFPEFALWAACERVAEAESTGADVLVSTCPFCSTNLQDAIRSRESKMRYMDLTEVVLNSLEGVE